MCKQTETWKFSVGGSSTPPLTSCDLGQAARY